MSSPDQTDLSDLSSSLRDRLEAARKGARTRHRTLPGLEATHHYSDDLLAILRDHVENTARELRKQSLRSQLCVAAVGGFGRRELSLFSDIDFVFLLASEPTDEAQEFIRAVLYPLWDLGLDLGYAVLPVREIFAALGSDLHKTTSLLHQRPIWGDETLCEDLSDRLHARLRKSHLLWFVEEMRDDRRQRHERHGDTVNLLEPDLKNSRGGLRDLHILFWLTFATFGETRLERLAENGLISDSELIRLQAAWSFLLDMRNSLHLAEGRRVDKLSLERQIRVAEVMNITSAGATLAEENLMRTYYEHAGMIDRLASRMLESALRHTPGTAEALGSVSPARRVFRDFWARGSRIWIEERDIPAIDIDPYWPLRLFHAAARERLEPSDETLRHIEERHSRIDEDFCRSPIARDLFLGILRTTSGFIAPTLRSMNRCGFLHHFLPEWSMVRNLPRLDHYHAFTVDEHLIRSIDVAESLQQSPPPPGMEAPATVAREILRLDLLHLALLLHDMGKGEGRGHVIRGMHIAQRVAERLELRPVEQEIVRVLVANHQRMTHMALRRDPDDASLARELAEAIGRPEVVRMLYVHSACDLAAVSSESWNDWRGQLLTQLYERTMAALRGTELDRPRRTTTINLHERVLLAIDESPDPPPFNRADLDHFLANMPDRYLRAVPTRDMARHFLMTLELDASRKIIHRIDTYEGSDYVEVTFAATDAPGLFSHLCGALASRRLYILSAQVYTATSGEAIDVFQLRVPPNMMDDIDQVLERMASQVSRIMAKGEEPDWTPAGPGVSTPVLTPDRLRIRPPRVDINNDLSPTHTVLEVRAPDQPGILGTITRILGRFSINIDLAFIATESYQVVDVFYVTDLEANKITEAHKLQTLRDALLRAIHDQIGVEAAPAGS